MFSIPPRDGNGRPTGLAPGQTKLRETISTFYNDPVSNSANTYNLPSAPKFLHLAKSVKPNRDPPRCLSVEQSTSTTIS